MCSTRVPYDKRPAKARCPACETIFEAERNKSCNNTGRVNGNWSFPEFEDEYLEAFYEFHERKPGQRVRNGDIANILTYHLHQQLKWFKD